MKESAIRCRPSQHKWESEHSWGPKDYQQGKRDQKCKHCGLYLQCFKGKHKYNGVVAKLATCALCGKLVKRRKRYGVMNPSPR